MGKKATIDGPPGTTESGNEIPRQEVTLKAGALQNAIFNSANFSSIATDERGVIQIFNVGAERMLGYTAAEVLNRITPAEISDPNEIIARAQALSLELGSTIAPGFEALVFKASRGIEDIYELTYIRKDGSRFPAVVSVTALRDVHHHDDIIGYLLIGTDNTARQQIEEERKKLDQRLRDQQFYTRSLIESNIDALMTTDPLGIITDVNKQMEALTGSTRDELIGAPFKDCFTDPGRAEAGIKRVLDEKKVTDYELTARARDGKETVVSYNATTFYDRGRKLQGVFAAARDMTERKLAEELQRTSSAYARSLIEASLDPLVTISAKGKITDVNEASVQATGVPREQLIGTDFSNYFTEPEKARAGYEKAFSEGLVRDYPLAIHHATGRIVDVLYNAAVYRDDQGHVLGLFAAARDVTERKLAEEQQRTSSAYARSLIEASLDPLVTISAKGKITDVNEASVQATGVPREQLIGTDFSDYFTEPEKARAGYEKAFSEGLVRDYPLAIRHATGRIVDVLYNAAVYRDDKGNVLGLFAAARDVTERKRFEQSLQEANRMKSEFLAKMSTHEQLRQLLAHSPAVIFTVKVASPADFPQVVSDNITLMLGFTIAETSQPAWWSESLHPEDRKRVLAVVANRVKDDGCSIEYRIRHHDGTYRWLADKRRLVRKASGQPREMVGVWSEITERKQAEESQHQAEAKYRSIFDNAVEGIMQTTPQGDLITANPALARMLGYESVEEVLASSLSLARDVYVNPADRMTFTRLIEAGDFSNGFQCQVKRKDGQPVWVSLNGRTTRDANGAIQFYDVTCVDITEGRKLEEQVRQSQKMEAVGQLAGGIAHDFNNILGAIIGNTELAQADTQISPATVDGLKAIMQASVRASDLVRQILTFSRREEQERQPVQLHFVVGEALKLLRSTVPATIELETHLANTPTVLADPSQIHQIVMNLCTNAAHALRGKPGTIKVELAEVAVDAGVAQTHADLPPGNYVRLTVADNGCGMDRATRERIFEPFFTTKAPGEGTGLGLSVVHGIMKSHDGGVAVYSQPGEGTAFHLYFPVLDAAAATEAEAEAVLPPVPRGRGEHVLFVDDELPLLLLGQKVLEDLGYQVTTERSGMEALAAVREQTDPQFDLVVTDLTMPGMSGAELARQLLALQPLLPIILTTGYSPTLTPESTREMGFRDLLLKPNTGRTLGEAVHRVLTTLNPA